MKPNPEWFRADAPAQDCNDIADGYADYRSGADYQFDKEKKIELAVNVALATSRPLLVIGESGQGKSALADGVACRMSGRRYIKTVMTARSSAEDLLWRMNSVRRLADAQTDDLGDIKDYVQPGPLWRAISPATAAEYGNRADVARKADSAEDASKPAILLIDEIDKADPDVPNGLLVALGTYSFEVPGDVISLPKEMSRPLVIITSNDTRSLPAPFVRRCVVYTLEAAQKERLIEITKARCKDIPGKELEDVVDAACAWHHTRNSPISPAEVIDAVEAYRDLKGQYPGALNDILQATLGKAMA